MGLENATPHFKKNSKKLNEGSMLFFTVWFEQNHSRWNFVDLFPRDYVFGLIFFLLDKMKCL